MEEDFRGFSMPGQKEPFMEAIRSNLASDGAVQGVP